MEEFHSEQHAAGDSKRTRSSMPPCCGTGCAVCVLDYWVDDEPGLMSEDEFTEDSVKSEKMILLEAFEEAERQARQMNMEGE
jgi:hypothetical protein